MKADIDVDLQTHLDGYVTSIKGFLKIIPSDGPAIGLSGVSRDIAFGGVTYKAARGLQASAYVSSSRTGIDNAEAKTMYATTEDMGLTRQQVAAGYLDNATYELYILNYRDPAMGFHILSAGKIGAIGTVHKVIGVLELRSWSQYLRDSNLCDLRSLTCRAEHGNPLTLCQAPVIWNNAVVASVGGSADRVFSAAVAWPDFVEIQWLDGNNDGLTFNSYDVAGSSVTLWRPTPYVINPGDGFKWRAICDLTKASCKTFGQLLNMQAEIHLPESEGKASQTPGAVS
jgi:uncharacterized phage protein (TIGR02218 family)